MVERRPSISTHTQNYKWYNFIGKITAQPQKNLRLAASLLITILLTQESCLTEMARAMHYPYEKVAADFPNWTGLGADLTLGNNFMASLRGGYFMYNQNNQKLNQLNHVIILARLGKERSDNGIYSDSWPSILNILERLDSKFCIN